MGIVLNLSIHGEADINHSRNETLVNRHGYYKFETTVAFM